MPEPESKMVTISLRIPRHWVVILDRLTTEELFDSPSALHRRALMDKYPQLRPAQADGMVRMDILSTRSIGETHPDGNREQRRKERNG